MGHLQILADRPAKRKKYRTSIIIGMRMPCLNRILLKIQLVKNNYEKTCKISNPLIQSIFDKKTLFFVQIIIQLTHEKIHIGRD